MMKKGDTGGGNPVLLLILANFFVKFFGLLREVLIAAYYGTTDLTDAYLIAHSIPTIAFALIGSAIATTYIPMYSKVNSERDETSANTFTLHLLVVLLFFCLMISLLGELFTKNIVWIFAPGFSGEKLTITENFSRILFPSVFAMTLFDLFGSYLQWHEKFRPVVLVPMIGNIVIIVSLYISSLFQNVYIFVWGTFWGLLSQVFFYLPWVSHTGLFSAPWGKIRSDTYLKQLLPLIIPVLIGTGANEINSIIDKSLVSSLDTGSVAALNFSYKIIYLVVGVLVAAIVTVMYPRMANLANEPDQKLFVKRCNSIIQLMFAVLFPVSCLIIIYRYDIISILFQRGCFNSESTEMTAAALVFYSVGLSAIGVRDVLFKVCFCKHDTKTPMLSGIICAGMNVCLDIALIKIIQHRGAALATSLAEMAGDIFLIIILNRRGLIDFSVQAQQMFKTILFSSAFCGFVFVLYNSYFSRIGNLYQRFFIDIIIAVIALPGYVLIQDKYNHGIIREIFSFRNS